MSPDVSSRSFNFEQNIFSYQNLLWRVIMRKLGEHSYPGYSTCVCVCVHTHAHMYGSAEGCSVTPTCSPWAPFQEAHHLEELRKETDPFQTPLVMEGPESQSWPGTGLWSPRQTRAATELSPPSQAHAPQAGLLSWSWAFPHTHLFSWPLCLRKMFLATKGCCYH